MDSVDEYYKDKNLSLLKKLTLIIPTYNRNYYLSRCLWYHAHFPYGQIIVADSSPEEKKIINRETVAKVREKFGVNILYLEYPPETEKYGGDIYRKWSDAVFHVETEYSVFSTDKEFTIPTTQCKCIDFLDGHKDYGSADGIYFFAEPNIQKKIKIENYSNKLSLEQSDPLTRFLISAAGLNTSSNIMALRRSELHKYLYKKEKEYSLCDIRFGEFNLEYLTLIHSKYHFFSEDAFNCRDNINLNYNNSKESSCSRYPYLDEYISDGIYTDIYNRCIDCLTNDIINYYNANNIKYEKTEIEKTINTALQISLERRGFYGYNSQRNKTINLFMKKHNYLSKIYSAIKPYIFCIFDKLNKNKTDNTNNFDEINLISNIILKTQKYHNSDKPII